MNREFNEKLHGYNNRQINEKLEAKLARGYNITNAILSTFKGHHPAKADLNASLEREVENRELAAALNRFLAQLPETERALFVSRYWFLAPVAELSKKFGFSESKTASILHRTRGRLRRFLIEEGLA